MGKRRRYDSTIDFDDSIPEKFPKGKGGSDFFAVFGPVFRRNAMWSVKRPVPDLGDKDTPIAQTNKFYDFWNSFDSRRDPLAIAEKLGVELCNLAEAECREERRWMERENAKEGRRIKQAETDRIARLVKLADMHDPRMIAERERKKAEKEAVAAAKLATAEAARLEKEAKAKAAEEERLAKERQEAEKRRIDKEKKEEAKRAVRNSRQRVRKLHADASVMLRRLVRADQLQEVCLQLDKPALDRIADELEAALKKEKSNAKGGVVETTGETPSVVLLHKEIRQCGFIPSEDPTVRLDGEEDAETSTVTPDNGSESADQEEERDLTPEEIAAAEAAEEAKRKAEEERLERRRKEIRRGDRRNRKRGKKRKRPNKKRLQKEQR